MTIEHKHPTPATARYLYAHAFRCGFEGCKRPLYRIDEESGERTLNSRICHIKARREGGPRFDLSQTEEDNRSAANLILMCVEHASAIDDPKNLFAYTPEKLQSWKEKQLQDYDEIQQSWALDEAMTDEVLKASQPGFALSIASSNLELGGKGGAAPGAGGGGGAAIGPNARGGDGGDGGNIVEALIDLEALRADGLQHAEVKVGKGGEPATLFGQRGLAGEETVVNFVSEDGRILESIRAGAANGGFPGESKLPPDCPELSSHEISLGFRITALLAANAIEIRDGLAFVLGGSWAKYDLNAIPTAAYWTLFVSACWPTGAIIGTKGLFLSLFRPDGYEASRVAFWCDFSECSHGHFNHAIAIGARFDIEGSWMVRVHTSELTLSEINVQVNLLGSCAGIVADRPD